MKLSFLILLAVVAGCSSRLENLSYSKMNIKNYYESGAYEQDLSQIIAGIKSDFDSYKFSAKDAVIFDVDETTLSNYKYIKTIDFGYDKELWNKYLMEGGAEPITPVLDLYKWFLSKGATIIFLTGREESTCKATRQNLYNAGYRIFDTLICRREADHNLKAELYKSREREKLSGLGYRIIATIGDLNSDLEGEFTGKKYKLPNYIYSF